METMSARAFTPAEVADLRAAFPYFAAHDRSEGAPAYLDSAATSQRPSAVLDAERQFLETANAAVHRGTSGAVGAATEAFEGARAAVAAFVGASAPEQIVWAENATDALNIVALGIGEANAGLGVAGSERYTLSAGDEISHHRGGTPREPHPLAAPCRQDRGHAPLHPGSRGRDMDAR